MPAKITVFCCFRRSLRRLAAAMMICQFCPETPGADALQYVNRHANAGMSDAVIVGDLPLVHTVQVLPLETGGTLAAGNVVSQTAVVLEGLQAALQNCDSSLNLAVKLNFLRDGRRWSTRCRRVPRHKSLR